MTNLTVDQILEADVRQLISWIADPYQQEDGFRRACEAQIRVKSAFIVRDSLAAIGRDTAAMTNSLNILAAK